MTLSTKTILKPFFICHEKNQTKNKDTYFMYLKILYLESPEL